ncbi:hypothetical protein Leryth_024480 [Lithospermum erythrorhizon]|nr:hypothetical protein Leryth_024480 [Lithospermum erythrorhizon]
MEKIEPKKAGTGYYAANKEKINRRRREQYAANKEQINKKHRELYAEKKKLVANRSEVNKKIKKLKGTNITEKEISSTTLCTDLPNDNNQSLFEIEGAGSEMQLVHHREIGNSIFSL